MMKISKVSDTYSVSNQIHPDDMPAIKQAGFRTIMCNRHDGESVDQPTAKSINNAAKKHGIKFFHIPIGDAGIGLETMTGFSRVMNSGKMPVLAYCHTGGRCIRLWNAFQA